MSRDDYYDPTKTVPTYGGPAKAPLFEQPREDDPWYPDLLKLDRLARDKLGNDHNMMFPYEFQITTVVYVYLKTLFEYLRSEMQRTNSPQVSVNFMELLEFSVDYRRNPDAEKEGNLNLMVCPGYNAKLKAKNDGLTEDN